MGIFQRLNDAMGRKNKTVVAQETTGRLFVNPLCSNYENVYAQVRVLVDELKTVVPYGVSKNGKRLPITRTPELAVLQYPNEQMGYMEFVDLMFSTWLTESELNIHVWKDQRGNMKGYTVLPCGSRVVNPTGQDYFQVYDKDRGVITLHTDEVMTLRYSRNPRDIDMGVSPASAVTVYAQIADVIAQYQKAWFENGATPASITFIAAKTRADFDQKVHAMEQEYHGARNKGKTLFFWRQFLDTGESANEIEVKPIQANNSTMAIKEVMSIVSEEINKAFGVSPFLMGNDSSAKYDNAELSDRNFTKRRVYPALLSFWGQFQHELDRILGGLGYAINFDLDIPELTDRLKVRAEISQKNVENLTNLIDSGAAPGAAVKALGLAEEWLDVAHGIFGEKREQKALAAQLAQTQATTPVASDSAAASLDKPSHASAEMTGQSVAKESDARIECSHCHRTNDELPGDYEPRFSEEEKDEKEVYEALIELAEDAAAEVAEDDEKRLTAAEKREIRASIITVLTNQANSGAAESAKQIEPQVEEKIAGEIAATLEGKGYEVSEEFVKRLGERTDKVISGLTDEAKVKATEVLKRGEEEALGAGEIRRELASTLPKYRAELIARNETVHAFRAGHLENDKNLAEMYNLRLRKIWRAHSGACPICEAMDGQVVALTEAFPDSVEGKDGVRYGWEHSLYNERGELPDAHVSCRCYFDTEVIHG